jgi:hypothetical protein
VKKHPVLLGVHQKVSGAEIPERDAETAAETKTAAKFGSMPAAKTRPKPSGAEKPPVASRWSPLVLDALHKVVGQHDVNPDMSLDQVQKMVFQSKR